MNYYNEHDPKAAAWLRELVKAGHIADGVVDDRDIQLVQPDDLKGFKQCHFFAGIGGWSYALRLAGWPDDQPVWTGSCPCQPFSSAGKRKGQADKRHLWPEFHRLIEQCRPAIVFGEQVAARFGREWLAGVRLDLETLGYAVGAADLCAAGVGAPHIRQRLYWVGISNRTGWNSRKQTRSTLGHGNPTEPASNHDLWRTYSSLPTRNGRWRIEPGTFPLAHGIPGRVGLLRGYGNAIVPQVAATFIQAFLPIPSR